VEFVALPFPFFFVAVLTLVWALGRHRVARNLVLVLASAWFAWKWQPLFLICLVGSSLWNYACGEIVESRRSLLPIAVAGNLAFLGYVKYAGFFLDSIDGLASWLGLSLHLPVLQVAVPLGISFYTFQGIAYVVDCARGTAVKPGSFLDFLLFMSFFPKFAAGPICRSSELMPQILREPPVRVEQPSSAIALIVFGVFKKMILGTYLAAHMVEDVFQQPGRASVLELWVVMFAYTAQIYLDFSGYTDIARGCARLCGFELPENFRYPYAATNLTEYWRRWHMSFSRWLREYVYFPLGGSRHGVVRTALNLCVTFTLCGLWHGPRWGFVIWGALHGFGLIAHKLVRDARRARGEPRVPAHPVSVVALSWIGTLTFCAFARIYFKAESLETANLFARGLWFGAGEGLGLEWSVVALTAFTLLLNFVEQPLRSGLSEWHASMPPLVRPLAWTGFALVLLAIKPYDVAFTIYFGF
jgi:D-alanyl-lipoteichoic acid acyltransferase DltB (MBOAT superfamily)